MVWVVRVPTRAAPGSVSENKLLLNYCSCHGNILADSVLPPADLEEVDDTTVLGKLDQERIRTATRVRACNYVKIATERNFPPVLNIVTRTAQAA